MAIDYINTLGAGAGFNTKDIVTALVEAETAPTRSRLENKIEANEAKISAIAEAASSLNLLQTAAHQLNDLNDFNAYSVSNSQASAFSLVTNGSALPGAHSITVNAIASEQNSTIVPSGASGFSSVNQSLNSGAAFEIAIAIGDSSTVTTDISVTTATPQGIVDAINAAGIDVTAQLTDQGTSSTNYIIQLRGVSGTDNQFTITPSVDNLLTAATVSDAANAAVVLNGTTFTRSSNTIDDLIPGTTLALNSTTTGAASATITRDTNTVRTNIVSLVNQFNETKASLDSLNDRELDAALAGDSIFRSKIREIKSLFTSFSSTPGSTLQGLSDIGVSINRSGVLEINDSKLDSALSTNFNDVRTLLSADTNMQSEVGDAARGIAGDVSKFINDLQSSTGYFSTQPSTLTSSNAQYTAELDELEQKIEALTERYERQFARMNTLVTEMNNTRDNLISSFENLPFTSDK